MALPFPAHSASDHSAQHTHANPNPRPRFEVADILRAHCTDYLHEHHHPLHVHKVLGTLQNCRIAALGGHIDSCTDSGILRNSYNSCRDRHCPKCQGLEKERWMEARKDELLHTWGQTMERHIHLHCIVPGGALTFDGEQFKPCPHRDWLFPVKALSKVFRGKYLERLERAHTTTDCSPADTARP